MIKLNLLKEGHGILYKEKKTPLYIKFIRVSVVIFLLTGVVFFIMREELYTTWYIVSDEEGGIDLENFFKSEQDEDLEIQKIIKRPIEKEPRSAEDKQILEEKKVDLAEEKTEAEEQKAEVAVQKIEGGVLESEQVISPPSMAAQEKKSEELKPPLKLDQAVLSPSVKKDKEVPSKEAYVSDQIMVELSYRVVAGACLLRESADAIIENLKKNGYEDAYIKTATMPMDMYYLSLGEFKTTDEIDLIKGKNKSIDFDIENKDDRYILKTESVNSIKAAERLQRSFEKDGIAAAILKHKEKKDVFVVVVKNFNDYFDADTFNKELRDKGFASVVASQ